MTSEGNAPARDVAPAPPGARGLRVGVDVGGTFTDFALCDRSGAVLGYHKTPSTPDEPARAIVGGLAALLEGAAARPDALGYLGHGTTVATNQLIERRGAVTALVTTEGFRDVLEIARQTRPHLYDYGERRPAPLVPRHRRFELAERIGSRGEVLVAADEAELGALAERLGEAGVEAIAVSLLHAYRNPAHERVLARVLAERLPGLFVSVSSDVLPEFREFERTATTVANAYVGPTMARYLADLGARLARAGIACEPHTFHSNGGLMSSATAARLPVRTCLSGPAAGVVGVAAVGRAAGELDLVAFDVGGTSTDVSLVAGGRPGLRQERLVAGFPVKSPTLDVHVIGAGGGSIAWIDPGGALKVGPRSAGASPGPAAYGQGGTEPTVSDANLVLGRLSPAGLIGGGLALDLGAAERAVRERVATPLGLSLEAAAEGILQVAVANIARAIRAVSTERGHDLARFTLVAYGGAGPLLAAALAREVGCPRVLVPEAPGAMCARGALVAQPSTDLVRTLVAPADAKGWDHALTHFAEMRAEAVTWLEHEGLGASPSTLDASIDARYVGQGFEIAVALPGRAGAQATLDTWLEDFAAAHEAHYGYRLPGREVELVNCRMRVLGDAPSSATVTRGRRAPRRGAGRGESARRVFLGPEAGWLDTPIIDRGALAPGSTLAGPAVIEELTSTTLVPLGTRVEADELGNLRLALS